MAGARALAAAPKIVSLTAGQAVVAGADRPAVAPVALAPEQVQAVVTAVKVEDNTFAKAVTVDLSQAGQKDGGASQAALTLHDAIQTAVSPQSAPPIDAAGHGGFIGTIGAEGAFSDQPVNLVAGGLKRVRVVIKR
jgi:hypothetical protein